MRGLVAVALRLATAAVAAGAFGLGACSRAQEPAQEAAVRPTATRLAPVLNVPALLPLSVDGLRRRLGPAQLAPAALTDPSLRGRQQGPQPDSVVAFAYRGLTLVVAYTPASRQVNDWLLWGSDEGRLMQLASLRDSAVGYLVLPVFDRAHPDQLVALRVVDTRAVQ